MDLARYKARRKVPPATEIAELLSDGITLEEIAEACDAEPGSVISVLSRAGFSSIDGAPIADRPTNLGPWAMWRPQPWTEDALCAQTDPEAFFPEKGGSSREAIAVCRRCPVAAECLDYALTNNERHGIWGGVTERRRRRLAELAQPNPAA